MSQYKNLIVKDYAKVVYALSEFLMSNDLEPVQLVDGNLLCMDKTQYNFRYFMSTGAIGLLVFYFKKDGKMTMVPQGDELATSNAMATYISRNI